MKKIILEYIQALLLVLLLLAGFYYAVRMAWEMLRIPCFWWNQIAYVTVAAVLNFGFILWIQKT